MCTVLTILIQDYKIFKLLSDFNQILISKISFAFFAKNLRFSSILRKEKNAKNLQSIAVCHCVVSSSELGVFVALK